MTRRFTFLAALALVVSFATGAQAQSSGFATFNQQSGTGNPISYTRTGGGLPVMLAGTTTGNFDMTDLGFLASGPSSYTNATFEIYTVSDDAANITNVPGGVTVATQGGFDGYFSIVSNGTNLLSATFTNAILGQAFLTTTTQQVVGANLSISEFTSVSSDILVPIFDESFNFSFANAPKFNVSNDAFQNWNSNVSGTFAAVPEPATLAMAGLGIFALPLAVRVARRRRAN